jgi:hypothetical protein
MHDEQRRRDIPAFPQHYHRTRQRIAGALEQQNGFPGHEPAGVISHDPGLNPIPETAQPEEGGQGAAGGRGQNQAQRQKIAVRKQTPPMQKQGHNSHEPAKKNGGQGHAEGPVPEKGVPYPYLTVCSLVHLDGAAEVLSGQFPKGLARLISFCEISDKSGCIHIYLILVNHSYLDFQPGTGFTSGRRPENWQSNLCLTWSVPSLHNSDYTLLIIMAEK